MLKVYKKYIDAESGYPYWSNPRTGYSTWEKPLCFGDEDVEAETIPLPTEDMLFHKLCDHCEISAINVWCPNCNEFYCSTCYDSLHLRGKKSDHDSVEVVLCALCQFQVSTRICEDCDEDLCDNCMYFLHQKGDLRTHTGKKLMDLCCQCYEHRAVRNICITCDIKVCNYCSWYYHQSDTCSVKELPLSTFAMEDYVERKEKELREAEFNRSEKEKMKILEDKLLLDSVIKIQRSWKRKRLFDMTQDTIRKLKEERRLNWEKKKSDNKKKKGILYSIKKFTGTAAMYQSDTNEERILKKCNIIERTRLENESIQKSIPIVELLFAKELNGNFSIEKGRTWIDSSVDLRGELKNGQLIRVENIVYEVDTKEEIQPDKIPLSTAYSGESVSTASVHALSFKKKVSKTDIIKELDKTTSIENEEENRSDKRNSSVSKLNIKRPKISSTAALKFGKTLSKISKKYDEDSKAGKTLLKLGQKFSEKALNAKVQDSNQEFEHPVSDIQEDRTTNASFEDQEHTNERKDKEMDNEETQTSGIYLAGENVGEISNDTNNEFYSDGDTYIENADINAYSEYAYNEPRSENYNNTYWGNENHSVQEVLSREQYNIEVSQDSTYEYTTRTCDQSVTDNTEQPQEFSYNLPEGWEEAFDESSGYTYYYNYYTGVSSWDYPAS